MFMSHTLVSDVLSRQKSCSTLCLDDISSDLYTESLWYFRTRSKAKDLREGEVQELLNDAKVYKKYITHKCPEDAWVIRKYYILAMQCQIDILNGVINLQN